jgi:hypothetical protein
LAKADAGPSLSSVPDNEDYAALGRLLASPETWSAEDARAAKSHLRHQEGAVTSVHPSDIRRRASMEAVADDLRTAIATWERHR